MKLKIREVCKMITYNDFEELYIKQDNRESGIMAVINDFKGRVG